jgi:hypothetical protein
MFFLLVFFFKKLLNSKKLGVLLEQCNGREAHLNSMLLQLLGSVFLQEASEEALARDNKPLRFQFKKQKRRKQLF